MTVVSSNKSVNTKLYVYIQNQLIRQHLLTRGIITCIKDDETYLVVI